MYSFLGYLYMRSTVSSPLTYACFPHEVARSDKPYMALLALHKWPLTCGFAPLDGPKTLHWNPAYAEIPAAGEGNGDL